MNIQSFYMIVVLLVSRFFYGTAAAGLSPAQFIRTRALKSCAFQLAAVIPLMHSANYLPLFVFVTVTAAMDGVSVYRSDFKGREGWRIVWTPASVLMIFLAINSRWFDDGWSQAAFTIVGNFCSMYSIDAQFLQVAVFRSLIFTAGLLLVAHESNYIVVYLLKRNTSFFRDKRNTIDNGNGMGKLIGYLERSLVYILIISGNLSAIGFVLAAKALARFKELEKKDFAEYFLLGTMISMVFTIALSFAAKWALEICT